MKNLIIIAMLMIVISCKKEPIEEAVVNPPTTHATPYTGTYVLTNNTLNNEEDTVRISEMGGITYFTNPSMYGKKDSIIVKMNTNTVNYFFDLPQHTCVPMSNFYVKGRLQHGLIIISKGELTLDWESNRSDNDTLWHEEYHSIYKKI